jgi:two-component system sensor histidine kinase KdpD
MVWRNLHLYAGRTWTSRADYLLVGGLPGCLRVKIIFETVHQMNFSKSMSLRLIGIRVLRMLACLVLVAAITWIAFSVLNVNALIVGFAYVLAVLVVAASWGLTESFVTSVAATLCLNYYFLPPVLSFTIADPQNWVALFAFMVTAITASKLSASVRNRAGEAQARRIEVERLYQLSLSLMLIDTTSEPGPQVAASVKNQSGFNAVAFCDRLTGEIHFAGAEDQRLEQDMLRSVAIGEAAWFVSRKALTPAGIEAIVVPVALGGRMLGSLGAIGPSLSEPAVQAIANLVAIAIEHGHQQIALGRLEVARRNEQLRSVLLDALAHDFLTPLTSVKSAITTVRSEYIHEPEEDDFLAVVEEETDRLGEMINETTDMARIEPGKPNIRRSKLPVPDLIHSSLHRMKTLLDGRPLKVQIQEDISPVDADPDMIGLALRQLLGNAVKYSPPETTIAISASQVGDTVTIAVRDHGTGIPPDELDAIFERFYRGKRTQESVAGTGMGLSIARDIVRAHHGKLRVQNTPEGGAQFSFTLPAFHEVQLS